MNGIDHLVFVTPDLESARADFEALGFVASPRNTHPHFGTANYLVALTNSYFELIAIDNPEPEDRFGIEMFSEQAARGGDMRVIALRTDDATASAQRHRDNGIELSPPSTWSRAALLDDGSSAEASFTTTALPANTIPDATFFYCQHFTPELIWRPEWLAHNNTAKSLVSVTRPLTVPQDEAVEKYSRLFGPENVRRNSEGLRIELGRDQQLYLSQSVTSTIITVGTSASHGRGRQDLKSVNSVSIELI